jgi:hypothetical protein
MNVIAPQPFKNVMPHPSTRQLPESIDLLAEGGQGAMASTNFIAVFVALSHVRTETSIRPHSDFALSMPMQSFDKPAVDDRKIPRRHR